MRFAAALVAMLISSSAVAEEEVSADTAAAIQDGFEVMRMSEVEADPDYARWIDEAVIKPFMSQHAPGVPYGFGYTVADVNGDGFGDTIVSLRTPAQLTTGNGGPWLVALKDGRGWADPYLVEAGAIGLRKAAGWGDDLALIQEEGYRQWRP